MKRSLGLCILLLFTSSCFTVRQARLPNSFYVIGKDKQPSLFDPSQDYSIIYVLVPAAAESAAEDTDAPQTLSRFTQNNTLTVPASFFSADYPKAPTTPLFVYFDWKDSSPGINQLKKPADELANGLNYLQSLGSKCIVVAQGRGGLVFNMASNQLKKPIEVVVQLGTPVISPTENTTYFDPQAKKIGTLYTFYSEQPFTFSKPTLHPKYQNTYDNLTDLNSYSVLLLINNKQPSQEDLYSELVGKNILTLCYEIKKNYQINRDLFASLSSLKKDTNLMIGIRTLSESSDPLVQKEKAYSDAQKKLFTSTWKRDPELFLASGPRLRSQYRFRKG